MSNANARRTIMRGLRNAASYDKINFEINSFTVTNTGLRQVQDAIASQRIRVLHDRTIGEMMIYQPDRDRFITPYDNTGGNLLRRALIVHEGIHAYCDLRNAHWMEIQTSEAAAYIGQSLFYLLITNGDRGRITHSNDEYDAIFRTAWDVAVKLDRSETPSWGDYEAVREAIAQVPSFSARIGSPVGYNGVRPAISRQASVMNTAPHSSGYTPSIGPRRQDLVKIA